MLACRCPRQEGVPHLHVGLSVHEMHVGSGTHDEQLPFVLVIQGCSNLLRYHSLSCTNSQRARRSIRPSRRHDRDGLSLVFDWIKPDIFCLTIPGSSLKSRCPAAFRLFLHPRQISEVFALPLALRSSTQGRAHHGWEPCVRCLADEMPRLAARSGFGAVPATRIVQNTR